MSKAKISHRKKGAMATSIGALSLVTGGLVSACAAPTTSGNPVTEVTEVTELSEFTPSQVNLPETLLVAENFEFTGTDGTGTIRDSIVRELPLGYEYRVQNLRVSPAFVTIDNVNNLQEGDQISINIVPIANPTQLSLPESLTMEVDGLTTNLLPITPVDFRDILVPQTFQFTGINGMGTMQVSASAALPERYEFRATSERLGLISLPLIQFQGLLQNGDTIIVEIFDLQNRDVYPFAEPIDIVVSGLRDLDAELQTATFVFEGISGHGYIYADQTTLPPGFLYEASVNSVDWKPLIQNGALTNKEKIFVRISNEVFVRAGSEQAGEKIVTSQPREITVTGLKSNRNIPITLDSYGEFLTPEAFSFNGFPGKMFISINPGYELPDGYEYRVYIKRHSGTEQPGTEWPRLEDVRDLIDGDAIAIIMMAPDSSIMGEGLNMVVNLSAPSEYLQPEFFSIVDGKVVAKPSKPLPANAYYEFWVGGQDGWVKEQDTKYITPTTYVYVRLHVSIGERSVISDYVTLPNAAKKFLVPEAFAFLGFSNSDDMFIQIQPGFRLPEGLRYEVVVRGPQGTNGGRGPILSTTNLADVHSLKDGDVIEIAMFDYQGQVGEGVNYVVDLLDPSEYLKPEFFGLLDDGTMVERKPLPVPYYYEYKVGFPAPEEFGFGGRGSQSYEDEQKEFDGTYVRIHDLPKITADLPDIKGGNPNASSPFTVVYVRIVVSDPDYNIRTRALEMWIHTG